MMHGNNDYSVEYLDPIGFGKPLRYSLKGHRRLRVSDYRVVYRIDHDAGIIIVAIKAHR